MALTALAAAWVLGLALGLWWQAPASSLALWSCAAGAAGVLGWTLRRRLPPGAARRWLWGVLAALALLAGLWWAPHSTRGADDLELRRLLDAGPAVLRGQVVNDPEDRGATRRLRLAVHRVASTPDCRLDPAHSSWRDAGGRVQVTLGHRAPAVRYGDIVELCGRLEAPPELAGLDYPEYLARQGIHAVIGFPSATVLEEGRGSWVVSHVFTLRHRLAESLRRSLSEPQTSLAQAILLGLRSELRPGVREDFVTTGTSHLLAISGLHVGVLLILALAASTAVLGGGRWALATPLCAIWLYALLTGMAPPVVRAAIMGSLYLGGRLTGRQSAGLPALSAAAGTMAGLEPRLLLDVSFQLSFAAVASLVLLAAPITDGLNSLATERLGRQEGALRVLRGFNTALAVGIAATIGTLPLIAFAFNSVSLVGIPVTMLALPAVPLMLVGSAAAAFLGILWQPLGQMAGLLAWAPLSYLLALVHTVASVPGVIVDVGGVTQVAVGCFYLAMLLLLGRRTLARLLHAVPQIPARFSILAQGFWLPRLPVRWALLLMLAVTGVLWSAALTSSDGKLHVTFLDVGQGDATLIVTPSGKQVLVDGGPDPRGAVQALGSRMPLWDRSVDVVVLTHAHQDHLQGLVEVTERYRVGLLVYPSRGADAPGYADGSEPLRRNVSDGRTLEAEAGQVIRLGDGVLLRVLNPSARPFRGTRSDVNNNAVVLRLEYGEVMMLLAADIYTEAEAALLARRAPLDALVLKVAHHGSDTSSSEAFLDAVSPALAVVSAGRDNPFGHPAPITLERLSERVPWGRVLLTTTHGDVHFTSDGHGLWLETERDAEGLAAP